MTDAAAPPAEPPKSEPLAPLEFKGSLAHRVRTPTLIQIEAVECGAVTLGIILRYFGRYVTVEEAREASNVSRSGSSALTILKAARSYGLKADGWKLDLQGLTKLPLPFAVFWNFSHFVVVEGFERRAVHINDPATGPRKVSIEEFDASFTGVAMTFEKGPDFKPGGKRPNILASLLRRLPESGRPAMLFLILAGIGVAFTGLVTPTFQRVFVDKYLTDGMETWVKPMLWIMLATAIAIAMLKWLLSYVLLRFSIQLSVLMEGRFLWHVLRLPLSFFTQRYAGELAQRTTINDSVASLLTGRLARTCVSMLTILPYAFLLFTYEWRLASIGLSIALLNLLAIKVIGRLRTDANIQLLQDQGVLTGTVTAGLQNIDSIKATASEDDLFTRLAGQLAKVMTTSQRLSALSQALSQVPAFLNQLNTIAMLVIGGFAIMNSNMSIGILFAFQSLMAAFVAPFADLAGMGEQLQVADGQLKRLDDVLDTPLDPGVTRVPPADAMDREFAGRLELRNVTFGYNHNEPPVLSGINLLVEPGQRVAFVGPTGSGKSTLVMLVAGLLQPWSGEILFDGKPRSEWPRKKLGLALAYVSQQIFLFQGTITQNLTLFDPAVPFDDVERAARDACIHDVISARPGGYFADMTEGGYNFSGGQRQRFEIARALAQRPCFLVLDEATSALDPQTELAVDGNIRKRNLTCLISAHRLSTIRDAHEIIVLHRGGIAERGTHEALMEKAGLYSKLVSA